jgi:outer membrane biosynthesis protein TonB
MKLNKENFTKTIDKDIVRYSYNCNDVDFFLELVGQNQDRNINVFSGSLDDRKDLLTTKSSLEAWNHFENLLNVCSGQQGSSGGGNLGKNPQQNPNILPLLAIIGTNGGMTKIALFAVMDDKSQTKLFNFEVSSNTIPQPLPQNVFTVNWTDEDITQLLKCEVLLKEYDEINFEEEPNSKVFLFIPKTIANQGGEEGGNTEGDEEDGQPGNQGGEPTDKKGKKGKKGEPTNELKEDGEPIDEPAENGEPIDKPSEPTDKPSKSSNKKNKKGEPTDEPSEEKQPTNEVGEQGEPTDQEGEPGEEGGEPQDNPDEDGDRKESKGQNREIQLDFSQTIQQISDSTDGDYSPSELLNIFRSVRTGEVWLSSNNFSKIKRDLNLPSTMSARQFSQEIINSK